MTLGTILTDLASLITALTSLLIAIVTLRTRRVVNQVHSEVKTINGQTLAMLADANEGRRVESDIIPSDRTKAEQHYVDALTDKEPDE